MEWKVGIACADVCAEAGFAAIAEMTTQNEAIKNIRIIIVWGSPTFFNLPQKGIVVMRSMMVWHRAN
jgi:hypothetical protein